MALDPVIQFNEATLTAAEFDPQYKVLPNSPVESNDVNAIASRALRRTAYLNVIKANLAGATFTGLVSFNAGATVASGQTLTVDSATIAGAKTITGNTVFSGSSNTTISAGRKTFNRARVTLSDADQTVDVGDGDRFTLPASPASPRTITLDHTGTVPLGGETMTFFWNPGGGGGGGTQYVFEREDASVIAEFVGAQVADTGAVCAEFEYVFGVGWRLGKHSGTPNEYVPPVPGPESWDSYGVVPGASA
jgi:hypothetical protein